ncbi:MAG: PIN domain-containing protein [Novosphingobium sp.]
MNGDRRYEHRDLCFRARGFEAGTGQGHPGSSAFSECPSVQRIRSASRRKNRRGWAEISEDLEILRDLVPDLHAISPSANREALRIAERYQLQFYDALMIAVALENGATTLYSEDMQHGLVIDGVLTITNPFIEGA